MAEAREARESRRAREARSRIDDLEREYSEIQDRLMGLLPDEFVTHMRAAQKEMLLAMRSLLDAGIHKIEERERRRTTRRTTKVPVE